MKTMPLGWTCLAFAVAAAAQEVPAPNGSSPGQPPVIERSDIVPDVQAHVLGGPPAPGRHYSAVEIARSFSDADVNHDGELSREEARHARLMPHSFDEIDRNHDGVITRFEYQDGFQ